MFCRKMNKGLGYESRSLFVNMNENGWISDPENMDGGEFHDDSGAVHLPAGGCS